MITESVIQYTVSDKELNFSCTVDNKQVAERIEANLIHTKSFLNILNKYFKFNDDSYSKKGESYTVSYSVSLNKDGNFNGFNKYTSYYREDLWDGRAPISESNNIHIDVNTFINSILKDTINNITESIKEMEYITPTKGLFYHIPDNIFEALKNEISIRKNDLKIIKEYLKIK